MKKQIGLILMILGALIAVWISGERIQVERNNRTIELVADYNQFAKLANDSLEIEDILARLQQLGVSQIALDEWIMAEKIGFGYSKINSDQQDREAFLVPSGFNPEAVAVIKESGLMVVPRLELGTSNGDYAMRLGTLNPDLIIFNGNGSLRGWEDLSGLETRIGLVEFTTQTGIENIASVSNAVRVHGISQPEMASLDYDRIIARYLRAVRERNIRVLYIRPVLEGSGWEASQGLLKDLTVELTNAGYQIGSAVPYGTWQVGIIRLIIVALGIISGTIRLLNKWFDFSSRQSLVLGITGSLISVLLLLVDLSLGQQFLALLAAIVFPSLALTRVYDSKSGILVSYLKIALISFLGGLFVVGMLSGSEYLVKLAQFRGVKLMHLAPVAITFLYGLLINNLPFKSFAAIKLEFKNWFQASIPVKYLALAGICAMVAAIYILRTDNFMLPVSQLEITVREGLERLLIARPRTKEFMLGHPVLFLVLASKKRHPLLLGIAVVGQLSLINTFTHVHTPLLLSILRGFYGLIFGYLIGWIVWKTWCSLKGRFSDGSGFRILRIR